MKTNELIFKTTDNVMQMHFYEAMQIFAHRFGMPAFQYNSDKNALINKDGKTFEICIENAYDPEFANVSEKNLLKRYLYKLLSEIYGYSSPWGAMTGVRPTKILNDLIQSGLSLEEARNYVKKFYYLSDEKLDLLTETYENQKTFLGASAGECSIYIGVPFCPSICSYCTFGSSPLSRYIKRTDEYTDKLINEIFATAHAAENYNIKSIYIGGGTPTTLNDIQLEKVLDAIEKVVQTKTLEEFSVEAGRPDTITPSKLDILKRHNVSRISINPQSMNPKTLEKIGRTHGIDQVYGAFDNARKAEISNINMDLICGLPGENVDDFSETLNEILKLSPECVTVHTLSLKRASRLSHDDDEVEALKAMETEKMTRLARERLKAEGYHSFYMYRQKNCVGNNENVCYCKPGFESPYNIHIMEEDMTIFACGVGGVTKIVNDGKISRYFNMKSVEEYFSRYDDELRAKLDFMRDFGFNPLN